MCDLCSNQSVISTKNGQYCHKCFFDKYPNMRFDLSDVGSNEKIKLSPLRPIIIYDIWNISLYDIHILDRYKLPKTMVDIIDKGQYLLIDEKFFELCHNSAEMTYKSGNTTDEIQTELKKYEAFDRIIQVSWSPELCSKELTFDELISALSQN